MAIAIISGDGLDAMMEFGGIQYKSDDCMDGLHTMSLRFVYKASCGCVVIVTEYET